MTNQDAIVPLLKNDLIQSKKWLKIIGVGENGQDGLSDIARQHIAQAKHVFGGIRHLALLQEVIKGKKHPWPVPFLNAIDGLKLLRGENVVVLTSGDPMHYGAGVTLSRYFEPDEMIVYPYSSSFSLAAARLGWALQDVDCLSTHGRSYEGVVQAIVNQKKMLILANDGKSASQIAQLLCQRGYRQSQIFVLEHLEGKNESIHFYLAQDLNDQCFANLNIIAVNCVIDTNNQALPLHGSLPDNAFIHDGQITKQEMRAITLAHLAPTSQELLWDIGAGSGSISIEWLRLGYQCRAIAIEKDINRAKKIYHNGEKFGVASQLIVIEKNAIEILHTLEEPDAIFIGGGFTAHGVFECCWQKLKKGGRLIANAVTLESEALMVECARLYNGQLIKVELSKAQQLGAFHVWRQTLPITMMILVKA